MRGGDGEEGLGPADLLFELLLLLAQLLQLLLQFGQLLCLCLVAALLLAQLHLQTLNL